MMVGQTWVRVGLIIAACEWGLLAARADEPGRVTSLGTVFKSGGELNGQGFGFLGICGLEVEGNHVATFGLYQAPGAKPQFTFLILYKVTPGSRGIGQSGSGKVETDSEGKVMCDFELQARVRKRVFDFRLQLDRDAKTVTKDVLTVGGKDYGPGDARVFLADLTSEKPVLTPVKYRPTAVPDFAHEGDWGRQILAARQELIENSPEARALFAGHKSANDK